MISNGQYSRNDLIGSPISSFYANTEDRDTFLSHLSDKKRVTDYELPILNKDGSIIPCAISAKISFDAMGAPEKIICCI